MIVKETCYEEITDILLHHKRKVQSYLGIIAFPCLFIFCVIFNLIISYFWESPSFCGNFTYCKYSDRT